MDVRTCALATIADSRDLLALGDSLPGADRIAVQMGEERHDIIVRLQNDDSAIGGRVVIEIGRELDGPCCGRKDRCSNRCGNIDALMYAGLSIAEGIVAFSERRRQSTRDDRVADPVRHGRAGCIRARRCGDGDGAGQGQTGRHDTQADPVPSALESRARSGHYMG